ncbi:DUF2861 family protein [Vibrio pelagius]|uniref:DUF2861 family protein n=1 Tax=Vibrio pelagius TaxID=28169 RepID=UPI0021C31B8E|nr:DUF2861 family protein [Vibrio pelagius]
MKRKALPLLLVALTSLPSSATEWFTDSNALTQVHKHILNDDLTLMFESLVEVWQSNTSKIQEKHLNELFNQALNKDCGKTLTKTTLPDWISSVVIKRHMIQSPGRDTFRLVIDLESNENIQNISLDKWVDKTLSSDSEMTKSPKVIESSGAYLYNKRYNLSSPVQSGLYRLSVKVEDGVTWSTWIIFGEVKLKQQVRWASKDSWRIDKKELLNPYCPLPRLEVGLYDYVDEQYERVWGKSYESDYPMQLKEQDIPSDRYVLAVSMAHARWQGDITIEQTQTISKTYDISSEEELK